MTVCNLLVEMDAKIGMVAPDDEMFEYLAGHRFAPSGAPLGLAGQRRRMPGGGPFAGVGAQFVGSPRG